MGTGRRQCNKLPYVGIGFSLFSLFSPQIISERHRVFGRNPGRRDFGR